MFALIDCGTTNTRLCIASRAAVVAGGERKIGVRDTAITGSRDKLRVGIQELYEEVLSENGIDRADIQFAIASGMITSEIGLLEIPHLVAPVGLQDLSENLYVTSDKNILDIGVPICFIRGVRNNYAPDVTISHIRDVDFMRGEETQCIGIVHEFGIQEPVSIVVLSSHTKVIYMGTDGKIEHSITSMSGQLFEALLKETNVGKSVIPLEGEERSRLTDEEILAVAEDCVENAGLVRTLFMPRFMQVLLKTNSDERRLFVDAAIACDDMKIFEEMNRYGYGSKRYILFGHKNRCELYERFLKRRYGRDLCVETISGKETLADLTLKGATLIAQRYIANFEAKN